ncbi:unnamed protein product [Boreogadus saida]
MVARGHRTGPPPISPTKRKMSGDQADSDMDDNEHVVKMSRLFAAQLQGPSPLRFSQGPQHFSIQAVQTLEPG